ncbi:unnamed protein product (macronuclear) [Paramecium tetraurelia]|uniref:Chromo domain-containing protein n=1 Tax=Paramecium tetraurelia TaxID=5888 RepID=A0DZ60_PARTE|nr:uncharacterized protein GSPATT00003296001 [Paramecium tetraurelia]CAK88327.1 unnamed protein product [Paramecium tetraurelia]|eukprot:XP_001455724.1 hypothetical protein (macronuclear) [Paramecium tetraurelia strain d4-2]
MRIKSQPQKHQEDVQDTIELISIDLFSNEKSINEQIDECEQPLYEVESIIMKKIENQESHYLVKWKGYSELTWEPLSSLQHCQLLVDEFDEQHSSDNVIVVKKTVNKKTINKSKKKQPQSKKGGSFQNEHQIQSFQKLGRIIKIKGISQQQLKVNIKQSSKFKPKSIWINLNELHSKAPKELLKFYESLPAIQQLFKSTTFKSKSSTQH